MSRRRARAITLQGTGSHAGKTVLAAGLCRLLARRGLRVRPFKSQNMSLNAHVHRLRSARGRAGRGARLRRGAGRARRGRAGRDPAGLEGHHRGPARAQGARPRGRLAAHHAGGGRVLGVCGGYQMFGRTVADPHGVESGGAEAGLGLVPVITTLAREKLTRRVRARWRPDGPAFEGYEIHAGVTTVDPAARPLLEVEGREEGCASADGRVWGTHLHGLFEAGPARRHVLDWARSAARQPAGPPALDHRAVREAAYDRLADTLEGALEPRLLDELGAS